MPLRWYLRITAVLATGTVLSHTLTVWLLYRLHLSSVAAEPLLEPALVVLLLLPCLYVFAINPLVEQTAGRQRAEQDRLASEELLRTVVGASSIGVLAYRESGPCILANPAAAQAAGATQEELLRQDFTRLPSWKESGLLEAAWAALRSGQPAQTEVQITSSFGKPMWAEFRLVPFRLQGEGHLLVLIDEVSERRRRADALRESEERYRRLVEVSPEAILVSSERCIEFVNGAGLRLLGAASLEQVKGKVLSEVVQPSCEFETCPGSSRAGGAAELGCSAEKRCLRLDGTGVEVEVACAPFPSGKQAGRILLMRDITERKALEKHLRRTQRLENIGTLAAGIAHDLNNILAPIAMAAELLQVSAHDSQEDELVSTILASARRGADIVRQVLTFARGIEGQRALVQPRYLVKEVERIVRETFPKTISFSNQVPKELWPVLGDGTQLHQVLLNLCVNARDAMVQGGHLVITGSNVQLAAPRSTFHGRSGVGPHVLLAVSDTGQGIPAEILEKIFEPFFTTKEPGRGTGLGLSTVLGIVRSHGGVVDVASSPGRGATFKVLLPAQPGEFPAAGPERPRLTPAGQGQTVLVVDDEAHVRTVAERTLTLGGYRVLLAKDGQEALELFPRHSEVQAVVTDILMPRMDGVGLVRGLKRRWARLPVIACTGWGQEGVRGQLNQLGVKNVLNKPFASGELLRALDQELKGAASAGSQRGAPQ